MAANELLWLRVATLLEAKMQVHQELCHTAVFAVRIVKICFIVQNIYLALTTFQDKNIAIALDIALARTS